MVISDFINLLNLFKSSLIVSIPPIKDLKDFFLCWCNASMTGFSRGSSLNIPMLVNSYNIQMLQYYYLLQLYNILMMVNSYNILTWVNSYNITKCNIQNVGQLLTPITMSKLSNLKNILSKCKQSHCDVMGAHLHQFSCICPSVRLQRLAKDKELLFQSLHVSAKTCKRCH